LPGAEERAARVLLWFSLVRAWIIACAGLLLSCRGAYRPGELLRTGGAGATLGCLDVVAAPVRTPEVGPEAAVVEIAFGERCGSPMCVDLGALRGQATFVSGRTWPVSVRDPREEMHPALLDARAEGRERIIFSPSAAAEGDEEPREPWVRLCIDAATIACGSDRSPRRLACFTRVPKGGAS